MEVICMGRRAGKTLELIKRASENNTYIVVSNMDEARNLFNMAVELGQKIPYPVTVDELKRGEILGQGRRFYPNKVMVDNADAIIQ